MRVRQLLETAGHGRVLVVDGGGSLRWAHAAVHVPLIRGPTARLGVSSTVCSDLRRSGQPVWASTHARCGHWARLAAETSSCRHYKPCLNFQSACSPRLSAQVRPPGGQAGPAGRAERLVWRGGQRLRARLRGPGAAGRGHQGHCALPREEQQARSRAKSGGCGVQGARIFGASPRARLP